MVDSKNKTVSRPRPEPLYALLTTVPQDWFAVIVRGEDFHRVIHGINGWYVDKNGEFQQEVPDDPEKQNIVSPIRALLGREFVGIPPIQGMLVYKFAWNKYWRKEEKDGNTTPEYQVVAHDQEEVYLTPFESQYPLIYNGIEVISTDRRDDKEEVLIQIGVTITVRIRMRNPRIALCTNTDWFGQVLTPNIQRAIKEFAGDKTYDWMIREAKQRGSEEFSRQFKNSTGPDSFYNRIREQAGVEVIDIGITDIAANAKYQAALEKQAEAERGAKEAVITAEGEKAARVLKGEGEKEYERLVGEGKKAAFEAIAESIGPQNLQDFIKWSNLGNSKLSTYAEAGSKVGIVIDANGKPAS